MTFLPLEVNDQKVHVGFWKRFGALLVDVLVSTPFIIIFYFVAGLSLATAMISAVILNLSSSIYTIYFHYKFGATLGKMAAKIKVVRPNGNKIGFKQAFLRSSPDLIFALSLTAVEVLALPNADFEVYSNAGWMERSDYLWLFISAWYGLIGFVPILWYWGEFIVLLCNKRKRALHDFIANTVVIHREYAEEQVAVQDSIGDVLIS